MSEEKRIPNEYNIIDPEYEKCNHNINDENTSIVVLSTPRTFTFPEHAYGICQYCGKPFHYIKEKNGSLKIYEEKDDEKE